MQKNIYMILFLSLILFLIGCSEFSTLDNKKNDNNSAVKKVVAIDVEADFRNDSVSVALDDSTLASQRITTNTTLNAAWLSGPHEYPEGNHTLTFNIFNLKKSKSHQFTLSDTLTVRVNYNRTSGEILFQDHDGLIVRK